MNLMNTSCLINGSDFLFQDEDYQPSWLELRMDEAEIVEDVSKLIKSRRF